MKEYDNVHILDHPLIRHKVAIIRDKNTTTKQFREVIGEIATLMAFEAFKDVPTQTVTVETPLETVEQTVVKENSIAIVPILRAGLGMVDGILTLFPPQRSDTSVCTATKKLSNRKSTTASCPKASRTKSLCS